jgi:threonine aldolase
MAAHLGGLLLRKGIQPLYPIEANMVFIEMSAAQSGRLSERGFLHYLAEQPDGHLAARLVTSHATQETEVEALADAIASCLAASVGASDLNPTSPVRRIED